MAASAVSQSVSEQPALCGANPTFMLGYIGTYAHARQVYIQYLDRAYILYSYTTLASFLGTEALKCYVPLGG